MHGHSTSEGLCPLPSAHFPADTASPVASRGTRFISYAHYHGPSGEAGLLHASSETFLLLLLSTSPASQDPLGPTPWTPPAPAPCCRPMIMSLSLSKEVNPSPNTCPPPLLGHRFQGCQNPQVRSPFSRGWHVCAFAAIRLSCGHAPEVAAPLGARFTLPALLAPPFSPAYVATAPDPPTSRPRFTTPWCPPV